MGKYLVMFQFSILKQYGKVYSAEIETRTGNILMLLAMVMTFPFYEELV